MLPSLCKGSFIKHMCITKSTQWRREVEWKPWYQEHAVHLMVTLKSNKEELYRFSCFYTSQFSSFVAYNWKTKPSKISPVRRVDPHIEYTMPAVFDGLFKEDRVFWLYVDTCQVNASKDLLHTHARRVCTCRAWLSLHPLFSAYSLLGAYLLTTYTYKRIRLLTRIYGI